MVARFAGASLGLLAFATTAVAGLYVGNPPTVTLSRSILALFTFCLIGLFLGKAAQAVVAEYERNRRSEIECRVRAESNGTPPASINEGQAESGVAPSVH
jgi:hypothetical protein